jgi:hypothetical protein
MSYLDPFVAVGIGTQVMPNVYVIDSNDEIFYLGPGYFARVNDPACKTFATPYAGSSAANPTKPIVTKRAATVQDVIDKGLAPADWAPSQYVLAKFLEGWIRANLGSYGGTPQSMRDMIEKNIKCSP